MGRLPDDKVLLPDVLDGVSEVFSQDGAVVQDVFFFEGDPRGASTIGNKGLRGNIVGQLQAEKKFPKLGALRSGNPDMFYTEVDIERVKGDKSMYRVVATASRISKSLLAKADASIGSTVQDVEIAIDLKGNVIQVWYRRGIGAEIIEKQAVSITVPRPLLTVSASQRERIPPLKNALEFVGTVNSKTFFGSQPGTWLCTRLDCDTTIRTLNMVSYEFIFNEERWWPHIVFRDPESTQVPLDVGETSAPEDMGNQTGIFVGEKINRNGLRILSNPGTIFSAKDFNDLPIRWPDGYNVNLREKKPGSKIFSSQ